MLSKNQDIKLHIDGMTAEGQGVGHFDGQAVFVKDSAIGDLLDVHIILAKKTYAIGKISKILEASPDRQIPDCDVAGKCGGCAYRHITYEAELGLKAQKVEDAFKRLGHIDIKLDPIIGSNVDGYRNKAQYPVSRDTRDNQPLIGFYAFNTHRIVSQMDCKLQSPAFLDVLTLVRDWMIDFNIKTYDEGKHQGLLRHIYIRRAEFTGEIMVCLVINGDEIPHEKELLESLKIGIPSLKTVVLNINKSDSNVVLGKANKVLFGDGYINEKILGKTFRISPLSFFQVNSRQCEILYQNAALFAGLTGEETLLDLYCGTGTIGLTMADDVKRLIGVEIVPEAIEDAKVNATVNGIENAEFYCGDAAEVAKKLDIKPDVVLVDPPRKGMAESLIDTVVSMNPKRVVYISCDPATLARDCARFEARGYHTLRARPVDMFPRTYHVETVALLAK